MKNMYKRLQNLTYTTKNALNKPIIKNNKVIDRRLLFTTWAYTLLSGLYQSAQAIPNNEKNTKIDNKSKKLKKNNPVITVKDFGAVGDGTNDDAYYLQAAVDYADNILGSYICIPNYDESYLINSAIIITEPGLKIFGYKGPTYNRGRKKTGNIILDEHAECAFNLGNFRLWNKQDKHSNPADSWTISNIGVVQKPTIQPRIKNGFMFSSRTDGPDRGVVISECCASGLNAAVYVPNPDVPISLATMNIENCCFSNNNYSIYVEGKVVGARIVGNQLEQNMMGAIHGALDGPVYISDNMLEGQPNTINITSHKNGNRLGVIIERNYFEYNTGDFLIKIEMTTNTGVIIVKNNYDYNIKAKDFFVITGGGSANITLGKNLFEPRCVTFDQCIGTVKYGSRILDDTSYYRIRRFLNNMGNRSPLVIISEFNNLNSNINYQNILLDGKETYNSPYGSLKCVSASYPISLESSIQQFEVMGISIFCYVSQKDYCIPQLIGDGNNIYMDGSKIEIDISGKWCLLSFAFFAQKNTKNLLLRLTYSKYIKIAGITINNYGKHNNDGSDVKDIYPVMPILN